MIRCLKRDYDKKAKLPQALVEELARLSVLGQQLWAEARKANDFARFRPMLEKTIEQKRVTYDFHRLMDGATLLKCSEFGDAIIENMGAR